VIKRGGGSCPEEEKQTATSGGGLRTSGIRVLLALLAVVTGLEAVVRVTAPRLSGNIDHIAEIPTIAATLSRAAGTRVLFLGNSLTANAVDTEIVRAELERELERRCAVSKVTPDQTSLWEWYWVIEKDFTGSRAPDAVVVGFAWSQLEDGYRAHPDRLAGFFCGLADLPQLRRFGMDGVEQLGEFLAARASRAYATRTAIRNRLLRLVVPHYEASAQQLNDEQRARVAMGFGAPRASFGRLRAFASLLRCQGTRGVLVAMPVLEPYDLAPGLPAALAASGIAFLDYRYLPGIEERHFEDPIHLNVEGQHLFSSILSRDLAALLKR